MKTLSNNGPSHDASSANSTWRVIRTFLAEESPAMMLLLARALEQDERVMLVGSAMMGPKTLPAASSLTPDLVVMDEHFAGVDGNELTRRLKQLPDPPTIFIVSSDGRAESQSRSLAAGADAVLVNAPNLSRQIEDAVRNCFPGAETERGSLAAPSGRGNALPASPYHEPEGRATLSSARRGEAFLMPRRLSDSRRGEDTVALPAGTGSGAQCANNRSGNSHPGPLPRLRGNKIHALHNRYPRKTAGSRKGEPQRR